MSHRVLFGEAAQTLSHIAPEFVSSATYEILDLRKAQSDAARIIDSGAATVPSFTLDLDAAAGPNQADGQRVPVAATAGPAIGDVVVVVAASGAFEAFEVEGIETNDALTSASLLAGTYAASDTVRGVTMTVAVPIALYNFEDALDDQRPLGILWQYTTAAGLRNVVEPITIARASEASYSLGAALELVREGFPELTTRLPAPGLTLQKLGKYSLDKVTRDLVARTLEPGDFLVGVTGRSLLAARIIWEAAKRGYAPGSRNRAEFVAETGDEYDTEISDLTVGTPGGQATTLDTELVADTRTSTQYLGPILAS